MNTTQSQKSWFLLEEFLSKVESNEASRVEVMEALQWFLEAKQAERVDELGDAAFNDTYVGLQKAIDAIHDYRWNRMDSL